MLGSQAAAATIHGLVYEDVDRDGKPSAGEPAVANVVVAFGVERFAVTDRNGQFAIDVADDARGIVWARVPDGFTPGPVWSRWNGTDDVDLGLRRLSQPVVGPLTFIVMADTHVGEGEEYFGAADLQRAAQSATAGAPDAAFFTILGDVTQGSHESEYKLIDKALAPIDTPYIPVPGNHDWYDAGQAWFQHYGPDNYSFDIANVHFVVWNMALPKDTLRAYLGAELAYVPATMPIVALTHDPPTGDTLDVLHALGVDYLLTGHTHTNRVVDHDGFIELNTQPLLMGGLDFTPGGYRVVTIDGGRMRSDHHTVVDAPFLAITAPAAGQCVPATGGQVVVASELDAAPVMVTGAIDCENTFELRPAGGWTWTAAIPALSPGKHTLEVTASAGNTAHASRELVFDVCDRNDAPAAGPDWPQVGGGPTHDGNRARTLAPPLTTRWVTSVGGHVLTAPPVIAARTVFVAVTDLADGDTGGVVALDLASGAVRWRVRTQKPVRGGLAYVSGVLVTTQIDGLVLALDASTGREVWRRELSRGFAPQAGAVFSPPAVDGTTLIVGHQRKLAALDAATGNVRWTADPVPSGVNSQSAAAVAVGSGIAVGSFHRELEGIIAFDAKTGLRIWSHAGEDAVAVNAAPVISGQKVFVVSGATDVTALDVAGTVLWHTKLEATGFSWGNASVGTPALGKDLLIVPTMYGHLVALDAASGRERWRYNAEPGPLRGTHYRGARQPAFAASPVVTGDTVWTVDTAGNVTALDLATGAARWNTSLGVPVMAGMAVSGDSLVVASYDGTVRVLASSAPRETPKSRWGAGLLAGMLAAVWFWRRRGS
jgi:outer membrane protein assembly factor BamB/predicted phosphodiesterase